MGGPEEAHCLYTGSSGSSTVHKDSGSMKKGGVELPNYKCARGSTSLESIQLDRYFASPLFLWMPSRLWQYPLRCVNSDCDGKYTNGGLYQTVWQVVDIDGVYNIATESLVCSKCKLRRSSWDTKIINQLDVAHRIQFPCILTRKLACDLKVVRFCDRGDLETASAKLGPKL